MSSTPTTAETIRHPRANITAATRTPAACGNAANAVRPTTSQLITSAGTATVAPPWTTRTELREGGLRKPSAAVPATTALPTSATMPRVTVSGLVRTAPAASGVLLYPLPVCAHAGTAPARSSTGTARAGTTVAGATKRRRPRGVRKAWDGDTILLGNVLGGEPIGRAHGSRGPATPLRELSGPAPGPERFEHAGRPGRRAVGEGGHGELRNPGPDALRVRRSGTACRRVARGPPRSVRGRRMPPDRTGRNRSGTG